MSMPISELRRASSESDPIELSDIRWLFSVFVLFMIPWSGVGGAAAGFFSFFQAALTKAKRLILLTICLIPLILMVLLLLIEPTGHDSWVIIRIGCLYSAPSWMINAPSIIFGKHWFQLASTFLERLGVMPQWNG
ncbi:MAG: hypothetical protein ACYSUC_08850 [Planctomycetota bacterium]|jgi:hypothetical protein